MTTPSLRSTLMESLLKALGNAGGPWSIILEVSKELADMFEKIV